MSNKSEKPANSMTGTKWKLFQIAVKLFAKNGFANTSVRDIASAAKLNPASIYNYFPGKEAFLTEAYNFYRENFYAKTPKLEDLLKQTTEIPPHELLRKVSPDFGKQTDILMKIVTIAIDERSHDKDAYNLVMSIFGSIPRKYFGAILEKLIKENRIEPLNINNFVRCVCAFNLYAATQISDDHAISVGDWQSGLDSVFELVHEK